VEPRESAPGPGAGGRAVRVADTPTPSRLYVHDDLDDEIAALGPEAPAAGLIRRLRAVIARDPRVTLLGLTEQIEGLVARGAPGPFAVALGIGRAGERVARRVDARTGWFPVIRRIELAREEDGAGGYRLATPGAGSLASQTEGLDDAVSVAVVDDTVFSGLTMEAVLRTLSPAMRARTQAFCLRAVAESLPRVAALCPVSAGFAAPGRLLEEVSLINASGLFRRGAIRRAGAPPLAFHERPEWIRAWFPHHADQVIALCREIADRVA
jgi:hypothetical protein